MNRITILTLTASLYLVNGGCATSENATTQDIKDLGVLLTTSQNRSQPADCWDFSKDPRFVACYAGGIKLAEGWVVKLCHDVSKLTWKLTGVLNDKMEVIGGECATVVSNGEPPVGKSAVKLQRPKVGL